MGLFQQLASPSPFFFLQSKFPYTVKHTRKQCIHGLVLLRNLYGYSIYCFLHVAKHKLQLIPKRLMKKEEGQA